MGFFDRLPGKKPSAPAATSSTSDLAAPGAIVPRLAAAREKLAAKDLAAALAIYEEVLAAAGDRADVLVTISGDLGSNGHVAQIIELVAPRYDAERHGPATGLNLLQAYLALRNAEAAQHVLDILFSLNRDELEERLHGFSNAIAELIALDMPPLPVGPEDAAAPPDAAKIALITVSKPVWFYGLESLAAQLLPPKEGRLRRIAFAQLALPGAYADFGAALQAPEDELGRLSRALPLWLAETFYFSPHYAPAAAIGLHDHPTDGKRHMIFSAEWTLDNLRQLVDSSDGGFDYIFTGALRRSSGDYELLLRVWDAKKFRERKQFTVRWTPATAAAELTKLSELIRTFMEWTPEPRGLPYAAPADPRVWLDALGASLGLFLAGKNILPKERLTPLAPVFDALAPQAATSTAASLAWLTLQSRARALGLAAAPAEVPLSSNPFVSQARQVLGL